MEREGFNWLAATRGERFRSAPFGSRLTVAEHRVEKTGTAQMKLFRLEGVGAIERAESPAAAGEGSNGGVQVVHPKIRP
jgi:hypothetical protein